jgi:hypothetical protein
MRAQQSKDVWVDVFELSRYRGRRRRLHGPARFVSIRTRSVDWGICIDSLVVGPQAYVRLFRAGDGEACVWLLPRQGVKDLDDLKVDDAFDSLAVHDRPPRQREQGYAAYRVANPKRKPAAGPRVSRG